MTDIKGPARLGRNPSLKYVGEDKVPVCEFSAIYQNYSKNKDDPDNPLDKGFWVQVSVWGKFAEPVSKLFQRGDRVFLLGNLDMDKFTSKDPDNEGEEVEMLRVNTNMVFAWTADLESLTFKPRNIQPAESEG